MPKDALIDVLECPTLIASYSDSVIEGNAANPSNCLILCILSLLPVSILWG